MEYNAFTRTGGVIGHTASVHWAYQRVRASRDEHQRQTPGTSDAGG